MQNLKKKCMATKLLVVELFWKFHLHYHGVYQISSFEANLSLEDLKQLCRKTQLKNNN